GRHPTAHPTPDRLTPRPGRPRRASGRSEPNGRTQSSARTEARGRAEASGRAEAVTGDGTNPRPPDGTGATGRPPDGSDSDSRPDTIGGDRRPDGTEADGQPDGVRAATGRWDRLGHLVAVDRTAVAPGAARPRRSGALGGA